MNVNNINGNISEKTKRNAGRITIGTLFILMLLGFLTFSLAAAPVSAELAPQIGYELYQIKLSDWAGYPDYVKYSRYDKVYELCLFDKAGSSVKSRNWEVDDPYWSSSSKEKFSIIYTPDDVDKMKGKVKVKLTNMDGKGSIDYVYANELEIGPDGKLTGRYVGEIVDGHRKAELLKLIAQVEKVNLAQTIAVGDGANDLPMISEAGLGIAFHAKPRVVANAEQSINTIGLDGVLYFLGFKDSYLGDQGVMQ